ncbi:MAG: hypothetical protein ABIR37_04745 [Candidatus Saccharimonadales bacterium]
MQLQTLPRSYGTTTESYLLENLPPRQRTHDEILLLGSNLLRAAFDTSAIEAGESDGLLAAAFALRDSNLIVDEQSVGRSL